MVGLDVGCVKDVEVSHGNDVGGVVGLVAFVELVDHVEKQVVWDVFGESPRGACGAFAICGIAEDLGDEQSMVKSRRRRLVQKLLDLKQEPVGRMGLDVLQVSAPRDGDARPCAERRVFLEPVGDVLGDVACRLSVVII